MGAIRLDEDGPAVNGYWSASHRRDFGLVERHARGMQRQFPSVGRECRNKLAGACAGSVHDCSGSSCETQARRDTRILTVVDALAPPTTGELRGMAGSIRPKEKRFKEIWFLFRPDRAKLHSIEVFIDDGKPEVLAYWHAEVESCDPPAPQK